MEGEWVTVEEAAAICRVRRRTIYRWIKAARIDAWQAGPYCTYRIRRSSLPE